MLDLDHTTQFKRDLKLASKKGKKLKDLEKIIEHLREEKSLPPKHRNHRLKGEYSDCWECHIEPDWLLIYFKTDKCITLV